MICGIKDVAYTMNIIITWGQYGLQDGNSPIIEELIFLHDFINLVLIFIISFVGFIMISIIYNTYINKNLLEIQIVESVWTIIPAIILIQIALPSLLLLYMLDESVDRTLTIKAVGHQWYWRYEYSDFWSSCIMTSGYWRRKGKDRVSMMPSINFIRKNSKRKETILDHIF